MVLETKLRRRNLGIVEIIAKALTLDPPMRAEAHLELATRYLREG